MRLIQTVGIRMRRNGLGVFGTSVRRLKLAVLCGALLCAALLCAAGCGGPSLPPTHRVSGTVTYNDEPLAKADVRFVPVDKDNTRPGEGKTDSSGRFTISTFNPGDGVMPGEYQITVSVGEDTSPGAEKDAKFKSPIPAKYAKAQTSGLEEDITENRSDIKLELKD